MNRPTAILVGAAALVAFAVAQDIPEETERFVVVCPIDEMVDDGLAVVVERAVKEAEGAEAIIFVVDTFGGKVDSAINVTESILEAPCHTIAYIRGKGAISAGALISYACNDMVMSPATNIGAAQPVIPTNEGMLPTGEKEVSFLSKKIAALAEHNGHNPAIARAMVDKDVELYAIRAEDGRIIVWAPTGGSGAPDTLDPEVREFIDRAIDAAEKETRVPMDPVRDMVDAIEHEMMEREEREEAPLVGAGPQPQRILAKGKLLTLTAKEAEAYGVIRSTVDNVDQVLGLFDLYPAQKVDIVMTFPERAFRWLTNPMVAGILFMLAVGGLYLELKTPGFGLPGIVSIVAFTLFFGARAVLGLTDWIDLALVIIGLALIGVEVFVIPGFGVVGVAGILCLIAGLYLSFTLNDFEVPEYEWQYDRVEEAGVTMLTSFFLLTIFIIAVWKLLPYTPAYNWIVLSTAQNQDLGYVVQTVEQENSFIGLEGVAETVLRPAGKGRFGDQTVQVVSRAEFLPEGTPIVIVQVEGNRYVVNPLGDGSQENQV